jgi:hypothetical protein
MQRKRSLASEHFDFNFTLSRRITSFLSGIRRWAHNRNISLLDLFLLQALQSDHREINDRP